METDVLTHHGVKGMKWGVRKTKSISVPKNKKRTAKVFGMLDRKSLLEKIVTDRALTHPKREDTHNLSNNELRQRVERIKLDREYASLTRSSISKGRERIAKLAATTLLSATGVAAKKLLNKQINNLIG